MSRRAIPAPRLPGAGSDAAWAALDSPLDRALLPPLWSLIAEYFDVCGLWFLSCVPLFRLPTPSDWDEHELTRAAIRHDHPPVLSLASNTEDDFEIGDVLHAISCDSAGALSWLYSHRCNARRYYRWPGKMSSAECGSVRVLMWEQKSGVNPWTAGTASALAKHGHFDALRAVRAASPPCPWTVDVYSWAAHSGNVEMVKWVGAHFPGQDGGHKIYPNDADATALCRSKSGR